MTSRSAVLDNETHLHIIQSNASCKLNNPLEDISFQ